ncbi:MAG: hypothetical protein ACRC18_07080 [Cetobacterium sp.]
MPRIDWRINVSFKNNLHEKKLYDRVKKKGEIMGESAYIKMLVDKDMREEEELKKEKSRK